jgi:hypothetical protein
MEKIARANGGRVFSGVAPPHERLSFKDVDHGVLFAMMVNTSLRWGLDHKDASP